MLEEVKPASAGRDAGSQKGLVHGEIFVTQRWSQEWYYRDGAGSEDRETD